MAEQEKDKTEKATPFKLDEARRRGQVAKSLDFNSLFVISGLLLVLYMWGHEFLRAGLALARSIFERAPVMVFDIPHIMAWFASIAAGIGVLLAPFMLVSVLVMIAGNMIQTGPIFTTFPLKPDMQRLNPVAGFKRVFSMKMVFEGVKSLIKLALFTTAAYIVITDMVPMLLSLMNADPRGYVQLVFPGIARLIFKLVMVLLIIAMLDFAYTRWDFGKKMMMSTRDIKEETKRRDGDPHVRAKIRELQREAAKRNKSLARVPDADVLITNPTHFAVALRYERTSMDAPQVIGKGAGEMALRMRELAARSGVVVLERKSLARELFRVVDIDRAVPGALFEQVARVYAELYALRPDAVRVEIRT